MLLEPGAILGQRYEIIDKIGQGGMSNVYRAADTKLRREVAIKVLKEEFAKDVDFISKFESEASSAASLTHTNIVGVYDVYHDKSLHYIVMEYIEGCTLKDLILDDAPFDEDRTIDYGIQILNALKVAHRKGIIHRDIKPQNILVTSDEELKVTDFGIAKAVDSSTIVLNGDTVGSVYYFSPEQAKGKHAGETSDLYSCGIILFEMMTKHVPFESDNHVSIALKHINDPIPNPSTYNANISKGLERIILKATSKRTEERYQTADAMINDLLAALENPDMELNNQDADLAYTVLLTPEQSEFIRKNESINSAGTDKPVTENPPDDVDGYTAFGTSAAYKANKANKANKADIDDDDEMPDFGPTEVSSKTAHDEVPVLSKWIAIFGGIFVALIIVGSGVSMYMKFGPKASSQPEVVLVPNVVEMTVEEAQSLALENSLVIGIVGEKENAFVEPGTILEQVPKPDISANPNTTIQVVVSVLPVDTSVKVPDVVGLDSTDAQALLEDEGLWYYISREYSDYIELGKVIEQNPRANVTVEQGEYIELIISSGEDINYIEVPNLYNLSQSQAMNSLLASGLRLGEVTVEYSNSIDEGKVIAQEYIPYRSVESGTSVNIVVSMGSEPVPEVIEITEKPKPFFEELTDMFESTFSDAYRDIGEQILGNYADDIDEDVPDEDVQDEDVPDEDIRHEDVRDEDVRHEDVRREDIRREDVRDEEVRDEVPTNNNDADEPFDADKALEEDDVLEEEEPLEDDVALEDDRYETEEDDYEPEEYKYVSIEEDDLPEDFYSDDEEEFYKPQISDAPIYLDAPTISDTP
ncbi:MAG: hypothetical protein ATN33_03215, partial [Epulopiscium sp. Nele67-Bin001]